MITDVARAVADEVLFPAALRIDESGVFPTSHLDLLADRGLYGLAVPPEAGGGGIDFATECRVVEALATGCLCTTFVWLQHGGAARRVAVNGSDELRAEWLPDLVSGRRRAGVALGGTLPGKSVLTARATENGYVLDGHSPWVTGWGIV